jgi:all-trans-retinol dehydrogenase (NAD+)
MSSFRLLPREGLTLEAAYAPIRLTALNPLVTGPLLLALLKRPQVFEPLQSLLAPTAQNIFDRFKTGSTSLKILFAWGALRVLNNWFRRKVVNNWVSDTYDWKKEIVLVTGGSSGIGNLVVRDIVARGIKLLLVI